MLITQDELVFSMVLKGLKVYFKTKILAFLFKIVYSTQRESQEKRENQSVLTRKGNALMKKGNPDTTI
jgi:hypothetical protein